MKRPAQILTRAGLFLPLGQKVCLLSVSVVAGGGAPRSAAPGSAAQNTFFITTLPPPETTRPEKFMVPPMTLTAPLVTLIVMSLPPKAA